MTCNFGVVVDANNQLFAQSLGLSKGICMTEVHHVVAERKKAEQAGFNYKRNFVALCMSFFKGGKVWLKVNQMHGN